MLRHLQKLLIATMLLAAVQTARPFALLGPLIAWQTASYAGFNIGYDLAGDIGGPQSILGAYRWNVPVITYAFDDSFIRYFGTNGMKAVEEAFAIMNGLPEASRITNDNSGLYINGERVPTDTKRVNYEAQAIGLLDVKSVTMGALLEQLGLAEAERWVYSLRGRAVFANNTFTNWSTIIQNYDPITLQPTNRVNATFYTYVIQEFANPNQSDAFELAEDSLALFPFSSVAGTSIALFSGEFFTGLTHDDVGGLRFLLNPNNYVVETLLPQIQPGTDTGTGGSPWIGFFGTNFFSNTNLVFATNAPGFGVQTQAVRGGVNKLRFQRVNFDSLIGQTFTPITNRYKDGFVTNGVAALQNIERVIDLPDIIFSVGDLGLTLAGTPAFFSRTGTDGWANNDLVNGRTVIGGPGVITPSVEFTFTDKLPFFQNSFSGFLDDTSRNGALVSLAWGSFDGTTNKPVVYPIFGDVTLPLLQLTNITVLTGGN